MNIGTIKEVKNNENRVGLTPFGVGKLRKAGHKVFVQKGAGANAGFSDSEYKKAGATILSTPKQVVSRLDVLVKVKEPIKKEYSLLSLLKNKTLFTYLHLASADPQLTKVLMKNEVTAIAYETVEGRPHLPLLHPMSQVAGVLAVQYGAHYLQRKYDGRGVTLGKIDNADTAEVVVVGGGTVGRTAARTAAGLGCNVTVLQRKGRTFDSLPGFFKKELSSLVKNVKVVESTPANIAKFTAKADLLVGAVLVPGAKAPTIVKKKDVRGMKSGAVIVDVAIDQGGCVWGSKPTSHSDPIYCLMDKIYCNITNMPGQVARQSTQALTNSTLPYLMKIAKGNFRDSGLKRGINVMSGKIRYRAVAESLKMMKDFEEL